MTRLSRNRIARYTLEVMSGFIPFAGGLLSAAASAWADMDQDRANVLLRQKIETQVVATPPNLIFKDCAYRAEVVGLQRELQSQALRINRPRLFDLRRHTLDRQIEAMIYSGVYDKKLSEVKRRKKISDQLYELERKELNLRFDDLTKNSANAAEGEVSSIEAQRNIELQRLEISYGKTGDYKIEHPLRMCVVAR